jgi:DNA-binding Lrp family transcriptional regulator
MGECSDRTLLATLAEQGPTEMGSLANAVESHPVTVDTRCSELQDAGHLRRIGGGVYAITEDGRAYLETLSK